MRREWQPLSIYDAGVLSAGARDVSFDFGASAVSRSFERLCELAEAQLVEAALEPPHPLAAVLQGIGVPYPACWIALEIPTRELVPDWPHPKPGDIDMIVGILRNNRPLFDELTAIQVKVRKIGAGEDIRGFPSGRGTTQAHWTARMGFDRTLLLHFLVREPGPVPPGFAPSWNPITNSEFINAAKACSGAIRERLARDRELFGYGWLGWGQAFGESWRVCGGFGSEILAPLPPRPTADHPETRAARRSLLYRLSLLLGEGPIRAQPHVFRWDGRRDR